MCLQYRSTVLHCLFDVPYVEGRGETRFFDVPREPLRVGPGPRCESDSLRPTPISGGRGGCGGIYVEGKKDCTETAVKP